MHTNQASAATELHYPFDTLPEPGASLEVAPGVRWVRMRLPFALDHINLWLLDDGEALAAAALALLDEAGLDDKLWIIGGNLPRQDHDALRELGFRGVFPTGSRLDDMLRYIEENVR